LALALLLTAEMVFDGAAAAPAPTGEPRPAQAEFNGILSQDHALARAGAGTSPTAGKLVAFVPEFDDAGYCQVCTAATPVVAGKPAFSAPRVPSVRAPPAISAA
jgi:hypothetical protein